MEFKKQFNRLLESNKSEEKLITKEISFSTFTCICNIDPENIYGELKDSTHMKCVIKNYILYIERRNLKPFLSPTYIKLLYNILNFDVPVLKFILDKPTLKINTNSKIYNGTMALFLQSPYCNSDLLKHIDLINQVEFINFIKKHIIYTNLDKNISVSSEIVKNMTQTKFSF